MQINNNAKKVILIIVLALIVITGVFSQEYNNGLNNWFSGNSIQKNAVSINFGMSMLWFWVCYIIVTIVGILHTVFNIYVLHMKPMDKDGMGEGYEKTKPWHPLYNIFLFSLFGWLYMNGLQSPAIQEALITGAIWTGICIVFDLFGWVIIKHPWSLSFKGFYVDYQPWITLIYVAIFAGPVIGYLLV